MIPLARNDSATLRHNDSLFHLLKAKGSLHEAARLLDQNAMLLWKHNDLMRAEEYFLRSREINEQLGNQHGVAGINSNLAFIYADWGLYEKAYDYLELTLAVRRSEGEPVGIISALINSSVVLNNLGRYEESARKLEEALTLARQGNDETQMRSVYGMLSETYQKAGNVEKSLYYYNYYRTFNDYVAQKTVQSAREALYRQQLEEQNLRLENRNKQLELEHAKSLSTRQAQRIMRLGYEQRALNDSLTGKKRQNQSLMQQVDAQMLANELLKARQARTVILIVALILILALTVVGLMLLFRLLRQRTRHNADLQRQNQTIMAQSEQITRQNNALQASNQALANKNQEILSSVRYSKLVQNALLSHSDLVNAPFPDTFVINRPQAIISGDFYYARRTHDGMSVMAVGDCTGHGVPGAFLTIFTHSLLERALFDAQEQDPERIVQSINLAFHGINAQNTVALHSCDLALCVYNYPAREILFAGSQNGVVVCNPGASPEYIRGARTYLGLLSTSGAANAPNRFPITRIPMVEGQWIYYFSDGFRDQLNPAGHKFSSKRFFSLLGSMASEEGKAQKQIALEALEQWQQGAPQVDDIMLVGIRTL